MTREEQEAVYRLEDYEDLGLFPVNMREDFRIISNLIQKLQKENEKLKSKNQDLLRKLRNRVKEVKKLNKYSLYKIEFANLNKQIREKDKIIDLMEKYIDFDRLDFKCSSLCVHEGCQEECAREYFEKQVKEV